MQKSCFVGVASVYKIGSHRLCGVKRKKEASAPVGTLGVELILEMMEASGFVDWKQDLNSFEKPARVVSETSYKG